MIIAVARGKGSTGKTTVATSLARALDATTLFLDCDAEAPNAHLFLNSSFDYAEDVAIPIPQIDEAQCTYCGRCAEVCQYHAIAVVSRNTRDPHVHGRSIGRHRFGYLRELWTVRGGVSFRCRL
jgi:MinD superfamily P-loop ATPase